MKQVLAVLMTITLGVTLAGCGSGRNAGVFRSSDGGKTFVASSTFNETENLGKARFVVLANDPSQPNVIYGGLVDEGIVVSIDAGQTWRSTSISTGTARAIAINPQTPTVVLVAYEKQLIRTTDQGATFEALYSDPNVVTSVAIDPATPTNLWLGNAQGGVLYSNNDGQTWSAMSSFPSSVTEVFVSPLGSAVIVGTAVNGVHVSADRGVTFEDRSPEVQGDTFSGGTAGSISAIDQSSQPGSPLWVASDDGLFMSTNLGREWVSVEEPLTGRETSLSQVYTPATASNSVFLLAGPNVARSDDGGTSWQVRAIPTEREVGAIVLVDAQTVVVGVVGAAESFFERTVTPGQ
jgi:photosystem II stability/assembly factor-like uncharacterized protein